MSTERPVHSHDMHFDELLAGRVVTEAMTEFDENTPIEDVLRWLHERLSLVEEGFHVVKGFSAGAEYFQPTFTVDAITLETFPHGFTMDARFPVTPTDPEFIPANAWLTGRFDIDAAVLAINPTGQYYHYDTFSNEQLHGWGWADTIGSYEYVQAYPDEGTNQLFKYNFRKVDVDPTPPSEDPEGEPSNDFRGQFIEDLPWPHGSGQYNPGELHLQDKGVANKRVLILANLQNASGTEGMNQRIYFRGGGNYIQRGSSVSTSNLYVYIDGVLRSGNLGSTNGWYWYKIEAKGRFVRVKKWAEGASEPATWAFQYASATPTPGETYIDFNGQYGGIIVPERQGSPWTHEFKHLSVEGINTGPLTANAYLRPAPFAASAWLSQGTDMFIDAFIEPTFRVNALIVNYVPGHFTIGSFKEDRVPGAFDMDAHIGGYMRMDAVINDDAVMGSYTADAWKVITTADVWDADADVKDVDRTYSVTGDAIVHVPDLAGSYTIDAYKNVLVTDGFDTDAVIMPGAHPGMDAVIKEFDRPGSYTADAVLWPEGIEHFEINAAKTETLEQSLVTIDSAFDYIGETHDWTHRDDFGNRIISYAHGQGWGAPSGSGTYTHDDQTTKNNMSVSGGLGIMRDSPGTKCTVWVDSGPSLDREFYLEMNISGGGGISYGQYYFYIMGNLRVQKVHISNGAWYLQCYYSGAWNTIGTYYAGSDSSWKAMRCRVEGQHIQFSVWHMASGEPAWMYDGTPSWTPTLGTPGIQSNVTAWFSDPTWYQYFDNFTIEPLRGGLPHGGTLDAVIKGIDREYGHTADSYFVPQPFSMDAFIQGWSTMDARIWLGTTFPADSIKRDEIVFGGLELIPGGSVGSNGGSTYWQYNGSAAPIAAEQARVATGTSTSGSIKSKETFGPASGNAFPAKTNRTLTFYHSASPRDTLSAGVYDATLGTGHNRTGFYGFVISDYSGVVQDLINGSTGSSSSMPESLSSPVKFDIEYEEIGGGNSQMKIYVDDVLRRTSASFATPTWASFRIGFYTAYGIISGIDYLWYTPQMGSWRDGPTADAWIVSGAHIPFRASLVGHHINAWLKRIDQPGDFTVDMVKHELGEQLKSFTTDAWAANKVVELYKTQFGDLELGRLMWGDVTPEHEQLHTVASAIVRAAQTDTFTTDAYLEAPYLPEVLESILGDMQLGEDGLGWALKAFYLSAVLRRVQSETFTSGAILDKGHVKIDAVIVLANALYFYENYDDNPDTKPPASTAIWRWQRYS